MPPPGDGSRSPAAQIAKEVASRELAAGSLAEVAGGRGGLGLRARGSDALVQGQNQLHGSPLWLDGAFGGTLMRYVFSPSLSLSPAALALGGAAAAVGRVSVAPAGPLHALPPRRLRAGRRAVALPPVAARADPSQPSAPRTPKLAMSCLDCDLPPPRDGQKAALAVILGVVSPQVWRDDQRKPGSAAHRLARASVFTP